MITDETVIRAVIGEGVLPRKRRPKPPPKELKIKDIPGTGLEPARPRDT